MGVACAELNCLNAFLFTSPKNRMTAWDDFFSKEDDMLILSFGGLGESFIVIKNGDGSLIE